MIERRTEPEYPTHDRFGRPLCPLCGEVLSPRGDWWYCPDCHEPMLYRWD